MSSIFSFSSLWLSLSGGVSVFFDGLFITPEGAEDIADDLILSFFTVQVQLFLLVRQEPGLDQYAGHACRLEHADPYSAVASLRHCAGPPWRTPFQQGYRIRRCWQNIFSHTVVTHHPASGAVMSKALLSLSPIFSPLRWLIASPLGTLRSAFQI
jgi:hypothetical protein